MFFDLIDYLFGELKMMIYKIVYGRRVKYNPISKFSNGYKLRLFDKSRFQSGKNIVIRDGVKIRCNNGGVVTIGDGVGLNNNCLINAMEEITIGQNTIIGQDVKMYDHDHDYKSEGKRRYTGFKTAPISIGENVWIGSGCIILKGSKIGNNCVIAASTVVKGVIPENTIIYQEKNMVIRDI
ncbi:acyltransferase [Mediterraneibacter gnavus]|uniref:acyltransferase n=1 Tax=Mediterraneibacter gnavus TaxID=33038 RepID=UPI002AE3B1F3|nr:acyltransferase [Mediterraneibacter gnavus]